MINTVQRTWILIVILSIARRSVRVLAVPIGYSKDILLESQPTILEDNEKQVDHADKDTETYLNNNNNYQIKENVFKTTEDNMENFKTVAAYKDFKLDTVLNNEDDDINNYSDGFIPINKVNHFCINLQPNNWDESFDRDVEYEIIANNKDFNVNSTVVYITGTDEDILYLKEEIQRHGEGHELLVYFYLLRNITYYYLGHLITDSNILRECLSHSQSIFYVKNDSCFDLNNSNKNFVNQIGEVNFLKEENYREGEPFLTNDTSEKNAFQKLYVGSGNNMDIKKNLTLGMAPRTNVDLSHLFTINHNLLKKHPGIYVYQLSKESDVKSDKTYDDLFQNDSYIEKMPICYENMPQTNMSLNYSPMLESSLINSINMDSNSKPESTKSEALKDLNNAVSLHTNIKQNHVHGLQTKDKINYNKDNCKSKNKKENRDNNTINIQPYNFHEDNPIGDKDIKSSLEAVNLNPNIQNIQEKEEKATHQIKTHNGASNSAAPISTLLEMDTNSNDIVYQFPSQSLNKQNIDFNNINYESDNKHDNILQILDKDDELDQINYVPPIYSSNDDMHLPIQKEIQDNNIKAGVYPKALKTEHIKANKDYKTTKINTNLADIVIDEIDKHVRIEESAPILKTINYQPMKSMNDDYTLDHRAHDGENVHLNQLAIPVDKQDRVVINKSDYSFNGNENNVLSKEDMLKASNAMAMIQNEQIIEEKKGQGVYQISKQNDVTEKTMPTNTLLTVNPNSSRTIQLDSSQSLIKDNIPSHVINFWSDGNSPQRNQFSAETIKLDQNEYLPNIRPSSYTFDLPLQKDIRNKLVAEAYPNGNKNALEAVNMNVNTDFGGNSKVGSNIVNLAASMGPKNILYTKQNPNSKFICPLLSETNHIDAFPYHTHKLPNNVGYRKHKDKLQLKKQDGVIINRNSYYKNVLRTPLSTDAKSKSRDQNEKYLKEVNLHQPFITPGNTNSYTSNYIINNVPVPTSEATFNKNAFYNIVSPTKQHTHPMYRYDKLFSRCNENQKDEVLKNLKSNKWNVHKLTDNVGKTNDYNRNNHFVIKDVKSSVADDIGQLQDGLPANKEATERERFKIHEEAEQLEPFSFIKTDNTSLINPLTDKRRLDNKIQMPQSSSFLTTPRKQHKPYNNIKTDHDFENFTHYFQIPNKCPSLKVLDKNNYIPPLNKKLNNDTDRSTYLTKEPGTYKNVFGINGNKTSQINYHLPTIDKIQNTGYLSRQNSPNFFNNNKLPVNKPTYTNLFNKKIFESAAENTLPNQHDIINTNNKNILSNLLTTKCPIRIIYVPSEITKPTVQQISNAYKSLGDIKPTSSNHFYSTNPKKYKAYPNQVILSNNSQNDVYNKYSVGGNRKKVGIINNGCNLIENNDNDNMRQKDQNIKDKNRKDIYQISMQNDVTEKTIPTNTLLTVNPESSCIKQPFSSYSLSKDDIPSHLINNLSDGYSPQRNQSLDELDQKECLQNNLLSSYIFDLPLQNYKEGNKLEVEAYPNGNVNALDTEHINVNTDVNCKDDKLDNINYVPPKYSGTDDIHLPLQKEIQDNTLTVGVYPNAIRTENINANKGYHETLKNDSYMIDIETDKSNKNINISESASIPKTINYQPMKSMNNYIGTFPYYEHDWDYNDYLNHLEIPVDKQGGVNTDVNCKDDKLDNINYVPPKYSGTDDIHLPLQKEIQDNTLTVGVYPNAIRTENINANKGYHETLKNDSYMIDIETDKSNKNINISESASIPKTINYQPMKSMNNYIGTFPYYEHDWDYNDYLNHLEIPVDKQGGVNTDVNCKDDKLDNINYVPPKYSGTDNIHLPLQKEIQDNTLTVGVYPNAIRTENINANKGYHETLKNDSYMIDIETDKSNKNINISESASIPKTINYQPMKSMNNYIGTFPYYEHDWDYNDYLNHLEIPVDKQGGVVINKNDYSFNENNDNLVNKEDKLTAKEMDMIQNEQIIEEKKRQGVYQISKQNYITEKTMPTNTLLTVNPNSSRTIQPDSSQSLIKDNIPSHVINFWSDGNSPQGNQFSAETIELNRNKYLPNNSPSSYTFNLPLQNNMEGNTLVVEAYPNKNMSDLEIETINVNADVHDNSKIGSYMLNLDTDIASKNIDNKNIFYTKQNPKTKYIRPYLSETNYISAFPYHSHKLPNNVANRAHKNELQLKKNDGVRIKTNSGHKNILRTLLSEDAKNISREKNEKYFKEVNLHQPFITPGNTNSYPSNTNYIINDVPVPKTEATFNKNDLYSIVTKQHVHPMYRYDKLFSWSNENDKDDFFKNLSNNQWNVHKVPNYIGKTSDYNRNNHFASKNIKSIIGDDIDQLQDSLPANREATERERLKINKQMKQLEPLSFIKTDNNNLLTERSRSDNKVQMHQSPSFLTFQGIQKPSNNKKNYDKFGKLSHHFQIPNRGFHLIKVPDQNNYISPINRKPTFITNCSTYSIEGRGTHRNTNVFDRNVYKTSQVNYYLPSIDKIQNTGYLKLDNSPFYFNKNQSYVHEPISTTPFIKKISQSMVENTLPKSQNIRDNNKSNIPSKLLTQKHPVGDISMPFSIEITKPTVQLSTNTYKSLADVKPTYNGNCYSTDRNKYNALPSQVLLCDKSQHNVYKYEYLNGKYKKVPLNQDVARANNFDGTTICNEQVTESNQGVKLPDRYFFENKINSMKLPNPATDKTNQFTTTPEYIYNYFKTALVSPSVTYYRTNPPQIVLLSKFNNTSPMSDYISPSTYLPYHGYMLTTLPSVTTRYSEIPNIPEITKMGMRNKSLTSPYAQNSRSHLPSNIINRSNPFMSKPIIYENYITTEGIYGTPTVIEPFSSNTIKVLSNPFSDQSKSDKKIQMHQSPSFLITPRIPDKSSDNRKNYKKFGKFTQFSQMPNKRFQFLKVLDKNNYISALNRKPNFVMNRSAYSIEGPGIYQSTNVFDKNIDKTSQVDYYPPTIDQIQNTGYYKLDYSPFYFDKNQSYVHEPTSTTPFIKKIFQPMVANTLPKSQNIRDNNKSNIPSKLLTRKHPAGDISMPFSTEITKPTVQHSMNAYKSLADVKPTYNGNYYSTDRNKYNALPSQVLLCDKSQHNVYKYEYLSGKYKKVPLNLDVARANNFDGTTICNEQVTESNQGVKLPDRYFFENKINSMKLPNPAIDKTNQFTTTPEYIYNYFTTPSVSPSVTNYRTNPPQTVLLSKFNNTSPMSDYISPSTYLPYHGYMLTTLPSVTTRYSEIPNIPEITKMGMRNKSLTSPYSQNSRSHSPSNIINLSNPFISKPIIYENYITTEGIYGTPTAIEPFSGNTIKVSTNPFNDQSISDKKIQMHQSPSFVITPRIPDKPSDNMKNDKKFGTFTQFSQIPNKDFHFLEVPGKNNYISPLNRNPNFVTNRSTYLIEEPGSYKNTNVFDRNVDKTIQINYYLPTIDKIQNTGYLSLDNSPIFFNKNKSYVHVPTCTCFCNKKIFESIVENTLPKSQDIIDNNKSNIPSNFLTRKHPASVIPMSFSSEITKPTVQHSTNAYKGFADIKLPYNYFSKKRNNAIPKDASDLNQVEVTKHDVDSAKYMKTLPSYSSVRHPVAQFPFTLTSKGGYQYFQPSTIIPYIKNLTVSQQYLKKSEALPNRPLLNQSNTNKRIFK